MKKIILRKVKRENIKKIIELGFLTFFFLIIFCYGFLKMKDILIGNYFEIENISDGEVYHQQDLVISGFAERIKKLTLNDQEIFLDKNWHFSQKILLLPGYNLITLKAENKFKKIQEKNFRIFYFPSKN